MGIYEGVKENHISSNGEKIINKFDSDNNTSVSAFGVLPTDVQVEYTKEELTAFLHFGVNTFLGTEWGTGKENPKVFNPTNIDTDQWIESLANAGFGRAILTAKHHDGFCLWNSAYTTHSVVNSPWMNGKGDVVKMVSKSCAKYGIKFGVYLSPWDENSHLYGTGDAYNEYYMNQLTELLTNYGEVSEVWMDGAKGSNVEQDYKFDEWFKLIKKLQPNCVIFSPYGPDVRWIGNENGYAGEPCWSTVKRSKMGVTASPTYLNTGEKNGDCWIIGESDVSIRPGWFYHEEQDTEVKSLQKLIDIYFNSVGRNSVLLLNLPPDKRGLLNENDINRLKEFGTAIKETFNINLALNKNIKVDSVYNNSTKFSGDKILDGNYNTYWVAKEGVNTGTIEIDLEKHIVFDVISIQEYIPLGQRVTEFSVEIEQNENWIEIFKGQTIGYKRLIRLNPTIAKRIRINIINSLATPIINNIGVFKQPDNITLGGDGVNLKELNNQNLNLEVNSINEKNQCELNNKNSMDLIEFEKSYYEFNENVGVATFKVVRKGAALGHVEIDYGTFPGTAINGVNYQPWSGTLAFNAGETEKTINVTIINTNSLTKAKNFTLILSNTLGNGKVGPNNTANITLN